MRLPRDFSGVKQKDNYNTIVIYLELEFSLKLRLPIELPPVGILTTTEVVVISSSDECSPKVITNLIS